VIESGDKKVATLIVTTHAGMCIGPNLEIKAPDEWIVPSGDFACELKMTKSAKPANHKVLEFSYEGESDTRMELDGSQWKLPSAQLPAPDESTTTPGPDGGKWWIWVLLVVVILCIVVIVALVVIYCCCLTGEEEPNVENGGESAKTPIKEMPELHNIIDEHPIQLGTTTTGTNDEEPEEQEGPEEEQQLLDAHPLDQPEDHPYELLPEDQPDEEEEEPQEQELF